MKPTLIAQDGKALRYLKEGVDLIYGAVRRTLGPEARTTLMYRTFNRGPRNVDDGFYTSEVIVPKDPFVKLASDFFKEATMRTNRKVGDGTSATTVIAGKLFNELYTRVQEGNQGYGVSKVGVMQIKKDILAAAKGIKEAVRAASKNIDSKEELEQIVAVSLGEKSDLSKTIANVAWEVGPDGFIDVVEGYKGEVETEVIKGMRFAAKVPGRAFVNRPERFEMVIEDSPVFVTAHKMENDTMLRYLVEQVFQETKFTIIAPDFSEQVLVSMALSRKNGTFIWPVKVPSLRTEQLEDIAVACGATLLDKNMKMQHTQKGYLGRFEKLIVKDTEAREDAVLLGGKGTEANSYTDVVEEEVEEKTKKGELVKKKVKRQVLRESTAVKERIEMLKGQLAETREDPFKKLMERRIASMASAGGVIRVGAPTEAESLPLKLKIEDAVLAARAALRSGYVKGGGLCLKEIAEELPEDHILREALLAPYHQIQENAGGTLEIGEEIIDPTDAVYYAVEYATSVVSSLITVGNLIPEEPELQAGEGEMAMAKSINKVIYFWAKEKNIMSDNEREIMLDAMGRMTDDEYAKTHDN